MPSYYPPVGFHFRVDFGGFPSEGADIRFQSVTGINASVPNSKSYAEGGENRFSHRLPERATYENLILKRGMLVGSQLIGWFKDAVESFKFSPKLVTVTLLNSSHVPLEQWVFYNAWPTKWNIDGFDAEKSGVVIEAVEFSYQYFERKEIITTPDL
ncbi:MAG: phage tail protein [Bacteroidetes bacterium]|nr:phage tail protein [Bacteroidota bacterium]